MPPSAHEFGEPIVLRVLLQPDTERWTATCLEFGESASGSTYASAKQAIRERIADVLRRAIESGELAALLERPVPRDALDRFARASKRLITEEIQPLDVVFCRGFGRLWRFDHRQSGAASSMCLSLQFVSAA